MMQRCTLKDTMFKQDDHSYRFRSDAIQPQNTNGKTQRAYYLALNDRLDESRIALIIHKICPKPSRRAEICCIPANQNANKTALIGLLTARNKPPMHHECTRSDGTKCLLRRYQLPQQGLAGDCLGNTEGNHHDRRSQATFVHRGPDLSREDHHLFESHQGRLREQVRFHPWQL